MNTQIFLGWKLLEKSFLKSLKRNKRYQLACQASYVQSSQLDTLEDLSSKFRMERFLFHWNVIRIGSARFNMDLRQPRITAVVIDVLVFIVLFPEQGHRHTVNESQSNNSKLEICSFEKHQSARMFYWSLFVVNGAWRVVKTVDEKLLRMDFRECCLKLSGKFEGTDRVI